jgi:hypothetical protein
MPRPKPSVPRYSLHRSSGLASVRLDGRCRYLGKYNSPESREAYGRLIAELAVGSPPPTAITRTLTDLTVVELVAAYIQHAEVYQVQHQLQKEDGPREHLACRLVGETTCQADLQTKVAKNR